MVGDPLMDPTLIIHHAITCPNYHRAIPWTNSVQNISPNGMNRSSTSEPTTFVMSRRNYQLCLSTTDNLLWQFLGKTSITSIFTYLLGTDLELGGTGASICNLAWRCITPCCYICWNPIVIVVRRQIRQLVSCWHATLLLWLSKIQAVPAHQEIQQKESSEKNQ